MIVDGNDQGLVTGTVKWFDAERGFGFITAPGIDRDILLPGNVLRNFGQSSVADGVGISVRYKLNDNGRFSATEVVAVDNSVVSALPLIESSGLSQDQIEALPLQPAKVKWFDLAKGYGFATIFGQSGDIFIHVEVLFASGLTTLVGGEAVALRVIRGKRGGLMAIQVVTWEQAAALNETPKRQSAAIAAK